MANLGYGERETLASADYYLMLLVSQDPLAPSAHLSNLTVPLSIAKSETF